MSLKQQQKFESRERILNVASRLFKKNGFAATGIDQVMGEAGLTAGAFYAHFKSKSDLFEKSLAHSLKNSREVLFRGTEGYQGDEKIKLIMNRYISQLHRDLPEKGCALNSLAAEIYRSTPEALRVVDGHIQEWCKALTNCMSDELSEFQKSQRALVLISQAVGSILLSRMLKNSDLSNQVLQANLQVLND